MGVVWYALLFFSTIFSLRAQPEPTLEYKVKAVFLFNFTQFISWPESAFTNVDSPLVIGVLGENPFGTYLRETVAGEKIGSHPIVVEQYPELKDIKPCHILFIDPDFNHSLKEVPILTPNRGVLTVSDSPNFIKQGGMIRFYTVNSKIRLVINPEPARRAGLTISSKLLRLADIHVQ
ncbi:hypothetical protein GCM10027291_10940 [Telluribacter humicola]